MASKEDFCKGETLILISSTSPMQMPSRSSLLSKLQEQLKLYSTTDNLRSLILYILRNNCEFQLTNNYEIDKLIFGDYIKRTFSISGLSCLRSTVDCHVIETVSHEETFCMLSFRGCSQRLVLVWVVSKIFEHVIQDLFYFEPCFNSSYTIWKPHKSKRDRWRFWEI